jgi:hypothetical protein
MKPTPHMLDKTTEVHIVKNTLLPLSPTHTRETGRYRKHLTVKQSLSLKEEGKQNRKNNNKKSSCGGRGVGRG